VVPEILEPSLQLAAAVLGSLKLKSEEVSEIIDNFRRAHIQELRVIASLSGGSLGYGFDKTEGDGADINSTIDLVQVEDDVDVIMAKPSPA
jgi:enoyl reductase-like protein